MFHCSIIQIPGRVMRIIVFLFFLIAPKDIYSWDLAVSSDNGLNLLQLEHDGAVKLTPVNTGKVRNLYAIAFDPAQERFFISVHEQNFSIISFSLRDNLTIPLVPKEEHPVQGIAYDSLIETLFWSNGAGSSIFKRPMAGTNSSSHLVVNFPEQIIMGIAVSSCHRALFWANRHRQSPSLDRAELDGSKHVQIVTKDLYIPTAVTIDEAYGKVYWSDDREGTPYRIERCSLDGSERELVLQNTHQELFGIALAGATLFWTDMHGKKVWSLSADMTFPNHTQARLEPNLLCQYNLSKPFGIAAARNVSTSCEPVKVLRTVGDDIDDLDTSNVYNTDLITDFCLNYGHLFGSSCRCKQGYSGRRCEVPLCHNQCLNGGSCYLDHQGYPDCRCQPGYEGRRCERDVCDEYCLSGGRCFIESGQPSCSCPEGSHGQRCERTLTLSSPHNDIPIIAALGALGGVLLVVVVILVWRISILRRRPRVKRRYIVNKGVRRSQTPLTSRPAVPAVEQCEITIENCCNMNICETPCFEPNLRNSKNSSSNKKSEDKRNLIKNMEEEEPSGSE